MSLAESIIAAELASRKGEQDVFRRLQERNNEVEQLKKERAAMVAKHQKELSEKQTQMESALNQLEAERVQQIALKDCSISELRDVVRQLTSEPGMVVDEIRRAYVSGVRSPEKLRPPRLTEPEFRAPTKAPALMPEAELGTCDYQKLRKIMNASNGSLPGDQHILRSIQSMSQQVLAALEDTDSPKTQDECIAIARSLLKFVLDARDKCAFGDYVRPSQQHVSGPDISTYSIVDVDRSLSKDEVRELEQLAKQQDMMDDPMGLKKHMEDLAVANAKRLATIDAQKDDVENVQIASFRAFQAAANQVMHSVRTNKISRIRDEYDTGIKNNEAKLVALKGDLADVLTKISNTLQNINELQVCKRELKESLAADEKKCLVVNEEVEQMINKLEVYKYTLEKRKHALSAVGDMEQSVLTHIHELLLERGKDLFEGKTPMLMRQFEVLPNVYCQCAIFENL